MNDSFRKVFLILIFCSTLIMSITVLWLYRLELTSLRINENRIEKIKCIDEIELQSFKMFFNMRRNYPLGYIILAFIVGANFIWLFFTFYQKKCPNCHKWISKETIYCGFCKHDLKSQKSGEPLNPG